MGNLTKRRIPHKEFNRFHEAIWKKDSQPTPDPFEGKQKMGKICTYFGFKNGKLVSILQSVDSNVKKAIDCTYYITEPQEAEAQIQKWRKEKTQ